MTELLIGGVNIGEIVGRGREKITGTCSPRGNFSSSAKVPGPVLSPQHVTVSLPSEFTTSRSSGPRATSARKPDSAVHVLCDLRQVDLSALPADLSCPRAFTRAAPACVIT